MADRFEKLTINGIATICEDHFAKKVIKITAPGGKSRESFRVHFDTGTVIVTQRAYSGRMRLEVEVLRRLSDHGAPVPRILGTHEPLFFQEDVGGGRLSGALAAGGETGRADIVGRAFESILRIQEAGQETGLAAIVPPLGVAESWVTGLVGTPVTTGQRYSIPPPALDFQRLTDLLQVPANRFVKWDARPGNASVRADGQVYWFDWEHCGKRQGMEDFAWLAGDEFFPLGADQTIAILRDLLPRNRALDDIDYLSHFIPFHIVQRLAIIYRRFTEVGWVDPAAAMRYDQIGVDRALVSRLCQHGAEWSGRAALTQPLVSWFDDCARVVSTM